MHYYKKNIGDYHKKAGRLTMLEHGAYTLLLDACYDREEFPTLEDALDWTWARTEAETEAVKFVLSKFFTLIDGRYVQNRVMEELAAYKAKAETNARIAKDREEKRKADKSTVNGSSPVVHEPLPDDHESPPNHKPRTKNQEPILKKEKSAGEENPETQPNPDNLPSYLKPEAREPHDSRTMFEMTADWQPTDTIKPLLFRAQLPTDISKLDQSRIGDFVNHWFGKPERRTADGWNGLLVGFLKRRQHDKPSQPENTRKNQAPVDSRQVDGPIYPIFKDEPEPPRPTGIELEAMKITGQRILAGEKNVEYADVLAELQARRNAS